MALTQEYFSSLPVIDLARDLVGTILHSNIGNVHVSGIIVETEAYSGAVDKASHAYPNKCTKRTEVMFGPPGVAYVYLCYGMHHLFNIVAGPEGVADAVLIRALEPLEGIGEMERRRNASHTNLTSGPAKMSQALGITTEYNKTSLTKESRTLWLETGGIRNPNVKAAKRVGVDYAGEDADLPWRFYLEGNPWVSKIN